MLVFGGGARLTTPLLKVDTYYAAACGESPDCWDENISGRLPADAPHWVLTLTRHTAWLIPPLTKCRPSATVYVGISRGLSVKFEK